MTSSTKQLLEREALLRARRRRRLQGGAAFVESLIVISFILLVLFAVLWLQAVYVAKLQTLQYVRVSAWTGALQGCKPAQAETALLDDGVAQSNNGSGPPGGGDSTQGSIGGLQANTTGEESPPWFELRQGGDATSSVSIPSFNGKGNLAVGSSLNLMCNERGGNKELTLSGGDLLSNLAGIIRDLFSPE